MTSEQLQSVRAERWRQKSNPVLTAEDAKAWIEDIGLCLFLPRRHFLAATPSFAEAVLGAPSEAPGREALETATELMRRLAEQSAVVPLNLFGNPAQGGASATDQPDFLCSRATLPYIFSLIGGRNWKSGPGAKASPLMTEIWTLLNDGEARTAGEIQSALGRELTEAAVLRALAELWNGLRAIPIYDGDLTRWELTQARFAAEMTSSQKVAQTTALSALVSLYLDGAVAASTEDIETFLSPLTSRSRVREVVNGLSATRQLGLVSVGAQPLLHVAGALPEFAEEEPAEAEAEPRKPREERKERKPYDRGARPERAAGEERGRPERGERPFPKRDFREKRERPFPQREFGERRERPTAGGGNFPKRKFGDSGRERPGRGREERPWQRREENPRQKREERPTGGEARRPFRERREDERGGGKFGGEKRFGGRKEFGGREKTGFRERGSEGEGRSGRERGPKKFGGDKRFGGREKPRFFRERGEGGGRPEGERGGKRFGRPEFGGEKKPRFFRERGGEGEGRPERERGPKKFGGDRQFGGREKPRFPRERGEGEGRPERDREARPGAARGKAGFAKQSRPAYRGEGKRGFSKERKPFGKTGGGNFPKKPGKGGFGKSKPGGFKPPFRKRKKQEGEE